MKINDWFTSHLDDTQRRIVALNMDQSFIVQGPAGSGKTILALHRANQASLFGTFAILVYTKALKNMIQFGLKVLDLPSDRVIYEWSWKNRGIELLGDVYVRKNTDANGNFLSYNGNMLFLKREDGKVEEYSFWSSDSRYLDNIVSDLSIRRGNYRVDELKIKEHELSQYVTIDFADYVSGGLYYVFYRRVRWYKRKAIHDRFEFNEKNYELVPSAGLFQKKAPTDYIIVDEAQDFDLSTLYEFKKDALKSTLFLGDSMQQVYSDRGISMDLMESGLQLKRYLLSLNYRLPKTVAKIAGKVSSNEQDLVSSNMRNNGNSDYPIFPRPIVKSCINREEELKYILNKIKTESLDDVGILVPDEESVKYVYRFFAEKGIDTQVKFKEPFSTGMFNMFRQTDTLDFTDPNNPSILTYHSAKGTQFENVFLPFSSGSLDRNPYYVALTRTSRRLFITHSGPLTSLLSNVPKTFFEWQ